MLPLRAVGVHVYNMRWHLDSFTIQVIWPGSDSLVQDYRIPSHLVFNDLVQAIKRPTSSVLSLTLGGRLELKEAICR